MEKDLKFYNGKIEELKNEVKKAIIGQDNLVKSLLIALLSGGHIILEGVPGLAKTLSIQTLSRTLDLGFSRISFTPDLLPGDLLGGQIYNQAEAKFYTKKGPIFTNFLLADEINRAPAKVQSALLEAMQERKITLADETFKLDEPFLVLATQNPIEQEGTYPLPEAQLDRFMLKTIISYPTKEEEIEIMKMSFKDIEIKKIFTKKELIDLQERISSDIYIDDKIYNYVKDIIFATRNPNDYSIDKIGDYISFGASPRASISLIKTAKVNAFLSGRDYVTPEDIKELAFDVLRHRIGLSFEALGEDIRTDDIIRIILDNIIVP
ncbi:MAG: AAA family ATPase [Candidatus Gracilibacteria bacterium]|nr:AAA family ATPase [Candidatus Gracilibacteria bacterium]